MYGPQTLSLSLSLSQTPLRFLLLLAHSSRRGPTTMNMALCFLNVSLSRARAFPVRFNTSYLYYDSPTHLATEAITLVMSFFFDSGRDPLAPG